MRRIKYKTYLPAVFFIFLVVLSVFIIKPLSLSIFLGALLAYLFYPLYKILIKRFKSGTLTSLLLCILVLLLIVIPAGFMVKILVQQSYTLYLLVKQKLAIGLFQNCSSALCESMRNLSQNEMVTSQVGTIIKFLTDWIIAAGSNFLISLPRLLLNLFVIFLTMFYFLKDGQELLKKLKLYFSEDKKYIFIFSRLNEILQGVVYGYLLIAFIQGAFGALGFFIFGIKSPLFWGVVMGFLALIPVLGTGVIWIPASLILLLEGLFQDSTGLILKAVGLFVYSLIFVGSIDNFLRPKLIGEKAKVRTVIIMLGMFGGIMVFGPLGVLIGPLVLSLTAELVNLYFSGKK